MKKKWIGIALISALLLVGCGQDTAEQTTPAPTEPETVTEVENTTEPAVVEEEKTWLFTSEEGDFTVEIPIRFLLIETQEINDSESITSGYIYKFRAESETLEISDLSFPGVTVDQSLIEEEIEMAPGMEVLRMDEVTSEKAGTFYGVLANDTSTGRYIFYHRIQKDDRIISFMQMRPVPYDLDEEAENKMMLHSLTYTD